MAAKMATTKYQTVDRVTLTVEAGSDVILTDQQAESVKEHLKNYKPPVQRDGDISYDDGRESQ